MPETVVLNERRESEPPLPGRGVPRWHAPAVLALFLVIATIAAAVGIAIGSGSDEAVGTATPPTVDACRSYDARAALAATNDTPAVDCSEQHSAQTFAVGDSLPVLSGTTSWTEAQLQGASETTCSREAAATWLGVTEDQLVTTRLTVIFFGPDAAQAKAG